MSFFISNGESCLCSLVIPNTKMAAADGGGTSVVSDENNTEKQEDETEKKHKLIIAEIENSEGHLGTAIR